VRLLGEVTGTHAQPVPRAVVWEFARPHQSPDVVGAVPRLPSGVTECEETVTFILDCGTQLGEKSGNELGRIDLRPILAEALRLLPPLDEKLVQLHDVAAIKRKRDHDRRHSRAAERAGAVGPDASAPRSLDRA